MTAEFLGGKHPFPPATILAKVHMRRLRIKEGLSMVEGAMKIGATRKQLEDMETHRPYGSHLPWLLMLKLCAVYKVPLDTFIEPLPARELDFYSPKSMGT